MNPAPETSRCGFIALIGAPNAGKSTLLNALVGAKVVIVTHKVQTTRTRVTGIANEGGSQLVFIDTPGIFLPRRRLDRAMVGAAWQGARDADLTALLIDAKKGRDADVERILDGLEAAGSRTLLVLNKIDLVAKPTLLGLADSLNESGLFSETFMVSALEGDGVDDFKRYLAGAVPEGPWLYPEDQVSDITERLMAAEITREQIYLRLHQELPYAIGVEAESWSREEDGSLRIEQNILVERKNHKGIVIGKGGRTLKAIGVAARGEMEKQFDRRVHLFLHVKLSEKWSERPSHYAELGLDFVE